MSTGPFVCACGCTTVAEICRQEVTYWRWDGHTYRVADVEGEWQLRCADCGYGLSEDEGEAFRELA
jgi:hypothetical protein